MVKRYTLIIIAAVVAALLFLPVTSSAAQSTDIHIEPNLLAISATYNGGEVTVSGEIPADTEVVIRLTGEQQDTHLLKKSRVFGILWMNTGMITFHDVPKAYMIYLPAGITESDLSQGPLLQNLGIGFDALKKKIVLSPVEEDKDFQFQEFIKLKSKEGLYSISENAISCKNTQNQMKTFTCAMKIPSSMPQGEFTVTTFIMKGDQAIEAGTQQLRIKETGLPAMISVLAFNHGALYGILATLIALGAGLMTGIIFKGGKGGH